MAVKTQAGPMRGKGETAYAGKKIEKYFHSPPPFPS
jgi:hypothetical protein